MAAMDDVWQNTTRCSFVVALLHPEEPPLPGVRLHVAFMCRYSRVGKNSRSRTTLIVTAHWQGLRNGTFWRPSNLWMSIAPPH